LIVHVAIPPRFSLVETPYSSWQPSSTGTPIHFFHPRVTILVSGFVALVPVSSVGKRDPLRPLFFNAFLPPGFTGVARVTSFSERWCCFMAGVFFWHIAAAIRLAEFFQIVSKPFFYLLRIFPRMEAYAVPKCSAISGQLAANVGASTPIFSKFYANFYRITLAYSDRAACGDVGSIGAFDSYLCICLVILFLDWGCGHHRPLFSWLAHLSLYSYSLEPSSCRFRCHSNQTFIRCGSIVLLVILSRWHTHFLLLLARIQPHLHVRCACTRPRHLLFSDNLLLDGVNEAARSDVIAHLMERRIASMLV
ncbi:hypothetical protein T4C_13366, partial [Trichinella pseudospiralis]